MLSKLSIPAIFSAITEVYYPNIIASLNKEYDITVASTKGTGVWNSHPDTDEFDYILSGWVIVETESEKGISALVMGPGDIIHIPKGVKHRGIGESEILSIHRVVQPLPIDVSEVAIGKLEIGFEKAVEPAEVVKTEDTAEKVDVVNPVPAVASVRRLCDGAPIA